MTAWEPRLFLEAELKKTEDALAITPHASELRFDRAVMLTELGRTEEAKQAYIALVRDVPDHFGALNNLGALLTSMGFITAARTSYMEAVKHHPNNPMGHINLANAYAKNSEVEAALKHFNIALQLAPDHPEAHQGLSHLLGDIGDLEAAKRHRIKGFQSQPIMIFPYRGEGKPMALLLLASAVGGTVPIRHHLDDKLFFTSVLFVDFYDPAMPFPPHQLVFNAVGDADLCADALQTVTTILKRTNATVINPPSAVLATGRADNAKRFTSIPGIVTPNIAMLSRDTLAACDAPQELAKRGFTFPLLLRSPGFHTGKYFLRIETPQQLADALPKLPGDELIVLQYIDAKSPDGKIRKYRVMMIDGQFYPLHVAVSRDWKVHYFSADMVENPAHRAEDEAFLNDMEGVLGPRVMQALRHIHDTLGLQYAGIDFSIDADGNLVLFEANATMVVIPPEQDKRWDYRRVHVERILSAIHALFTTRIKPGFLATITAPAA